jgi:hypothetical protein
LTSTDVDTVGIDPATFTITGGADWASFGVVDGDLVFLAAPDFEIDPHSYEIEVTANDGGNTTPLTITVNLLNDSADDPPEEGPFYLNNDEGVTTFAATDAPDIFVYDFSQADRDNDSFAILNFDPSEDTFIYTNADNPLETTQYIGYLAPFHVELETQYTDREGDIDPYPYGNMTTYNISASQGQYVATAGPNYDPNMDGDSNRDWGQDTITIFSDGGTHRAPISKLDYPDDSTAPIASDVFAHVYQGDPLDLGM